MEAKGQELCTHNKIVNRQKLHTKKGKQEWMDHADVTCLFSPQKNQYKNHGQISRYIAIMS